MSVPAPSRRRLLTATAWSVPAVMVATAAPAFAASGAEGPPTGCTVTGFAKDPGEGQSEKGYYVLPTCTGGSTISSVEIEDGQKASWRVATKQADGSWYATGFQSSKSSRNVRLNGVTTVVDVYFPPK